MLCPICGSEISDNVQFCGKCGSPIQNPPQVPQISSETKSGSAVSTLVHAKKKDHARRPALQKISRLRGFFSIGVVLYAVAFLLGIFAGGSYVAGISVGIVATSVLTLGFMKYPNQELSALSNKVLGLISKNQIASKITPFTSMVSKYPQLLAILGAILATIQSAAFARGSFLGTVAAPVFGVIAIGLTILPLVLSKKWSFGNSKMIGGLYLLAIIFIWLNGYGAADSGWFFSLFMLQAEHEAFKTAAIVENR